MQEDFAELVERWNDAKTNPGLYSPIKIDDGDESDVSSFAEWNADVNWM